MGPGVVRGGSVALRRLCHLLWRRRPDIPGRCPAEAEVQAVTAALQPTCVLTGGTAGKGEPGSSPLGAAPPRPPQAVSSGPRARGVRLRLPRPRIADDAL